MVLFTSVPRFIYRSAMHIQGTSPIDREKGNACVGSEDNSFETTRPVRA